MKKYSRCKEYLSVENFSHNRSKHDGLCDCCKICKREREKSYYKTRNIEKVKVQKHLNYLANKKNISNKQNNGFKIIGKNTESLVRLPERSLKLKFFHNIVTEN